MRAANRNQVMRWLASAALLANLVLPASGAAPILRLNSKLKSQGRVIRSVLVLPAEVALYRSALTGAEGAVAESNIVAETLYAAAIRELEARGATILPSPASVRITDEERYSLADLQLRFDTIQVQLSRKIRAVETGRYSLGDAVAAYSPAAKADAILFIRGAGQVVTGSKQVFRWATLAPALSAFNFQLTFVDARSGEVLAASNWRFLRSILDKSEEQVREAVESSIRHLPLPVKAAPAR